jgi:transcription initiation factor TFIIE subunit alpha
MYLQFISVSDVEIMESDDEELTPTVSVGGRTFAITDVDDQLIAKMTPEEKESYIHIYQEYYAHMYD